MSDFRTSFRVDQTPDQVYDAILDVRGWWTGDIDGATVAVGDEFTYRHEDIHRSTQRIIDLVPVRRVVWHVTDAHLSFAEDPAEWIGTTITFDIDAMSTGAELRFTHIGLSEAADCYESCSSAWTYLINDSLRRLITSGAYDDGGSNNGLTVGAAERAGVAVATPPRRRAAGLPPLMWPPSSQG